MKAKQIQKNINTENKNILAEKYVLYSFLNELFKKDITHPGKKIAALNKKILRAINLRNEKLYYDLLKENKKINYRVCYGEIGGAELWGAREMQEDRIAFNYIAEINEINPDKIPSVLKNTAHTLQNIITESDLGDEGSCLCSAVLLADSYYICNVGDSTAYLYTLDAKNTVVSFEGPLNTLHNPTTRSELKRVKNWNIQRGRLNGTLSLSRAIGDNQYEKYHLSHEPEIKSNTIKNKRGIRTYFMIACDGLTEGDCLSNTHLQTIIEKNAVKPLDEVATALTIAAREAGSSDNISILIAPMTAQAKYLAVFDGHGGDKVSNALGQLYDCVFKNEILLIKINELKEYDPKFYDDLFHKIIQIKTNIENLKDINTIKQVYEALNLLYQSLMTLTP